MTEDTVASFLHNGRQSINIAYDYWCPRDLGKGVRNNFGIKQGFEPEQPRRDQRLMFIELDQLYPIIA
jgi:hypothetical protein